MTEQAVETLSYEQSYAELEKIVSMLEAGQGSLEESIVLYERGQALARRCTELLDQAEVRLRKLSPDAAVEEE